MAKIIITVPDYERIEDVAGYVAMVGQQIGEGYLSGHSDAERHWTSEGVR